MNKEKFKKISSSFGLIEAPCKAVTDEFLSWQHSILSEGGYPLALQICEGTLWDGFAKLLPLETPITKYLTWPIGENWTLFFDNGVIGTDPSAPHVLSMRLSVDVIRVVMSDHLIDAQSKQVTQYGATIFEYYSKGDEVRAVYSANDGGRWRFGQSGEPFAFENVEAFKSGPMKDRFTHVMLTEYLNKLGVDMEKILPSLSGIGYVFAKNKI